MSDWLISYIYFITYIGHLMEWSRCKKMSSTRHTNVFCHFYVDPKNIWSLLRFWPDVLRFRPDVLCHILYISSLFWVPGYIVLWHLNFSVSWLHFLYVGFTYIITKIKVRIEMVCTYFMALDLMLKKQGHLCMIYVHVLTFFC